MSAGFDLDQLLYKPEGLACLIEAWAPFAGTRLQFSEICRSSCLLVPDLYTLLPSGMRVLHIVLHNRLLPGSLKDHCFKKMALRT